MTRTLLSAFICLCASAGSFQASVAGKHQVALLLIALAFFSFVCALAPKDLLLSRSQPSGDEGTESLAPTDRRTSMEGGAS